MIIRKRQNNSEASLKKEYGEDIFNRMESEGMSEVGLDILKGSEPYSGVTLLKVPIEEVKSIVSLSDDWRFSNGRFCVYTSPKNIDKVKELLTGSYPIFIDERLKDKLDTFDKELIPILKDIKLGTKKFSTSARFLDDYFDSEGNKLNLDKENDNRELLQKGTPKKFSESEFARQHILDKIDKLISDGVTTGGLRLSAHGPYPPKLFICDVPLAEIRKIYEETEDPYPGGGVDGSNSFIYRVGSNDYGAEKVSELMKTAPILYGSKSDRKFFAKGDKEILDKPLGNVKETSKGFNLINPDGSKSGIFGSGVIASYNTPGKSESNAESKQPELKPEEIQSQITSDDLFKKCLKDMGVPESDSEAIAKLLSEHGSAKSTLAWYRKSGEKKYLPQLSAIAIWDYCPPHIDPNRKKNSRVIDLRTIKL